MQDIRLVTAEIPADLHTYTHILSVSTLYCLLDTVSMTLFRISALPCVRLAPLLLATYFHSGPQLHKHLTVHPPGVR